MEQRETRVLNRKRLTSYGHRAGNVKTNSVEEFKLQMQNNSWVRIGQLAKHKGIVFNNLFHHFNVETLREAYHAQDGSKAVGCDHVTKWDYGQNLDANLQVLVNALHKGTYRPKPKRGVDIPKPNGKTRPIAIGSFEDKLVEWVLNKILSGIYEPLFIASSHGFRPKRSTIDAIKTVFSSLYQKKQTTVVDIDLKSFFDTVSHRKLIKMLEKRVSDRKILSLTSRLLEAGVVREETLSISPAGVPQGGVVSPTLSNIYLHYALDTWFLEQYAAKNGVISRYADDVVFTFKDERIAQDFYAKVKERLKLFDLQLNEDKSGIVEFKPRSGNVFHFAGFTFYWGTDRGSPVKRLRVKTQKVRLFKVINNYVEWLKKNRNRIKLHEIWTQTAAKLRGHYNYFGVYCNRSKLNHVYFATINALFRWLNRRSQKRSYSWERFSAKLQQEPLPQPPPAVALKPLTQRWGSL